MVYSDERGYEVGWNLARRYQVLCDDGKEEELAIYTKIYFTTPHECYLIIKTVSLNKDIRFYTITDSSASHSIGPFETLDAARAAALLVL